MREKHRKSNWSIRGTMPGKEIAHGAKGNPTDEGQRNDEETMWITDKTEETDYEEHDYGGNNRLGSPPTLTSPVIISSRVSGVAIMASNVF